MPAGLMLILGLPTLGLGRIYWLGE
jgi:hypothetical protein